MIKYPGSLHNHSDYSNIRLRDSIISINDMIDYAIELGHSTVAITDHECISGHLKAQLHYEKVKEKNPNFKLILGNEIYLCRNGLSKDTYTSGTDRFWHFILLAKDAEGHKQIREISTRAWEHSWQQGKMKRVPTYYQDLIDVIDKNKGHVIASTACLGSYPAFLARESRFKELRQWLLQMKKLFGAGNFYLEMQPPAEEDNEQDLYNHILVQLSSELEIPYIVTTDSHYQKKEDAPIHKAYLNSQDGDREVDEFYATTYMMSSDELESYFAHTNINLQIAYENIQKIADNCEDYNLRKPLHIPELSWKTFSPKSSPKEWYDRIPQLKNFYESGYTGDVQLALAIVERFEKESKLQEQRIYDSINECLDMTWESSLVNKTHWSAYFLNLQKVIDCCWEAGSLVGCGRGSGVGFSLLYFLDITQIMPLWETTQTFPWRFLNPSRVSVLDIDIDIEGGRREKVLNKLREVYGEDKVSNVITFGTEKSKSAILTAARGLGIDVDIAQYIASLVPSDRGMLRTLHQCYYGDSENDFAPVKPFIAEMNANPELWRVAQKIEGLVCRTGIHAGGVIFVDEPFTESTSLMRAPDGTIVTAYELHDCEAVSLIKLDLLSVEALDKIHTCLDLLLEDKVVEDKGSLKENYESVIGIYKLERNDPKMWKMIHQHKILSLFQMEKQSGIQGIALTKPESVDDLATLNSVIRLMAQEKGAEQPLNKYARFKNDINLWYQEMSKYGLTRDEQKLLEPLLLTSHGICESQEGFMSLVQMPECGGFDLTWSDRLRKSIAKKKPEEFKALEKEYFAQVKEKGLSEKLCNYVWHVLVSTSRGYGFNKSHTLAYSLIGLQEMNLAYKFPIIYWNTACLITDSGSAEEDKSTDYVKVAIAINKIRDAGIDISLVDINNSSLGFKPDVANNKILFGLKGLANINDSFIQTIEENRPYESLADFYYRTNPNRRAMISLIKGGAFDSFCGRYEAMVQYIWLSCDKKKRITLQNLPALIKYNLIPRGDEYALSRRVFEFNRYLKAECKYDATNYKLTSRAVDFLSEIGQEHLILMEDDLKLMDIKSWDKQVYQNYMDVFRNWISNNKEQVLNDLNNTIFMEDWNKYAKGNVSSWEMESLCFYYHEHELAHINNRKYNIVDFFSLSEEPAVDKVFKRGDVSIPIYKLNTIAGTCIAKNKDKGIVYLLTTTGVVTVKFSREYMAMFDKQISRKNPDGTKSIVERSWFNKGNMILIQGIRRGNEFVPKKYKNSGNAHRLYKIDEIQENGDLILRSERLQGDEEEDSYGGNEE